MSRILGLGGRGGGGGGGQHATPGCDPPNRKPKRQTAIPGTEMDEPLSAKPAPSLPHGHEAAEGFNPTA